MASTFTTNFGFEEIATGEQSGTWGTTTNFNFDILDRLAAYKAVGLSGTTHTLTVREASPGQGTENLQDGMYRVIKFTGALGANNTVTVAPNTAATYFIFENATTDSGSSGPYSVIISQGSGANVTIENGKSAIVYCDGAGSGAAVTNALNNLQVASLTVDGDATIGDDLTLISDASVLGFGVNTDVTLTHVHDTGLLLNSSMQLQFNDASQNINAPSATVLDINATDEIELNATLADVNANLDVSGTYQGGGTMTTGGNIVIPDAGNIGSASDTDAIAISSAGVVALSAATEASATGTAALTTAGGLGVAKDVWIGDDLVLDSDAAVVSFGDNQEVTLTHVHDTGLLLNSSMQLQFNDASQNINAPSATVLDINATDEIELNATLADVNANLDVSGTYQGGGTMTTGGDIVIPNAGNIGSASDTDAIAIASGGIVTFTQMPVFSPINTNIDMDNSASGQLSLDGDAYGFGIALNADAAQLYTNSSVRDIVIGVNETERMRVTPTGVVVPDAATIGSSSDTDAIAIASSGVVTFSQVPVFPDDTVETADIQDAAVTLAKMATNSVDSDQYVDGSIDNAHIADNAIDSEHYADGSIDNAHIADDAINSEHYAAGSIDTAHIADNQITLAKMAANSVDSNQYVDGSIDTAHFAAGSVNAAAMGANSVDSSELVDGSVDLSHMSSNSIDSGQYIDGSIDLAHMGVNSIDSGQYVDGSIDLVHMSSNSIDSNQYVDGSIDTVHLAADVITGAKIADNAIDSEHYTDGSIDVAHMAANSIDSAQYVDGSIDVAHMSVNSVDSAQYVDGSIDTVHIADNQITLAKLAGIARGKLIYGDASGDPAVLAVGSANQVLTHDGTDFAWQAAATGGAVAADDIVLGDAAINITTSVGNITVDAAADNTDIIFKGTDATSDITMLTLDGSEAGAATFSNAITSGAVITSGAGLLIADAGTIGSASDTDAVAIAANGVVTFSQVPVLPANTIDSTHYVDGSIDTAHIADDQITLAKMANGTDGNIISYDASGDPVAIATGSDGQVLTSAGAGAPPAFEDASSGNASCSVTVFTESDTWSKPSNLLYAIIEVQGGGGGGGGTVNPDNDAAGCGTGGGGGGYARKLLLAAALGSTETVTVGAAASGGNGSAGTATAGNASTFAVAGGTDIVGNGGQGGSQTTGAGQPGVNVEAGRDGGSATGGDINITGSASGPGFTMGNDSWGDTGGQAIAFASPGGSGYFGGGAGGGNAATESGAINGEDGTNGGGGGGAVSGDGGGTATGGDGGAGLVIVTQYLSA